MHLQPLYARSRAFRRRNRRRIFSREAFASVRGQPSADDQARVIAAVRTAAGAELDRLDMKHDTVHPTSQRIRRFPTAPLSSSAALSHPNGHHSAFFRCCRRSCSVSTPRYRRPFRAAPPFALLVWPICQIDRLPARRDSGRGWWRYVPLPDLISSYRGQRRGDRAGRR